MQGISLNRIAFALHSDISPLRSLVQDPGLRLGEIVMQFFPKIRRGLPSQSPERLIQLGIQARSVIGVDLPQNRKPDGRCTPYIQRFPHDNLCSS